MKKHIEITIIGLLLAFSQVALADKYSGGAGTEADPYQISTADDWQELIDTSGDWGGHFVLTGDIDFGGATITPVGTFPGVFDGKGYVLSNFVINLPGSVVIGLFRSVDFNGQIKNLGLESFSVTGHRTVGGLVASNNGIITNCYAIGQVSAMQNSVGGLVGSSQGSIIRSYAIVDVSGTDEVGGLLGYNYQGTIDYSYALGNVTGGDTFTDTGIGGLCGVNWRGTISRSYATGDVTGYDSVGGLVGRNINAKIIHCYSTGKPTGVSGYLVGGLVGSRWDGDNDEDSGNFWDMNTSQANTSAMGAGKTTVEMMTQSTFMDAGWDFPDTWGIVQNQTYPYLRTELLADLNKDGKVDFLDFAIFADQWLIGTD